MHELSQIKAIISAALRREVEQANSGILACRHNVPLEHLRILRDRVQIKRLDGDRNESVSVDGNPVWTLKRRFANRKVNGSYKALLPTLTPYKFEAEDPVWAEIKRKWAEQDAMKEEA